MNVRELRAALRGLPSDAPIALTTNEGARAPTFYLPADAVRNDGFRVLIKLGVSVEPPPAPRPPRWGFMPSSHELFGPW